MVLTVIEIHYISKENNKFLGIFLYLKYNNMIHLPLNIRKDVLFLFISLKSYDLLVNAEKVLLLQHLKKGNLIFVY